MLLHNEADGEGGRRFVDVTKKAELDRQRCGPRRPGWGDLDGDGYPEIYVSPLRRLGLRHQPPDRLHLRRQDPRRVPAAASSSRCRTRLYRNNRDGTFTDISD